MKAHEKAISVVLFILPGGMVWLAIYIYLLKLLQQTDSEKD